MPKNKRMRLPNGFGQITEIKSAKLRKPFRAMVTVGKNEFGKPICRLLKPEAYFRTYNDAYKALMKYHENPYDFGENATVKTLYERWFERHYAEEKGMSDASRTATARAWLYCKDVENIPIQDIRVRHIKHCMEDGRAVIRGQEKSPDAVTQRAIKSIFNQIFDYAIEYDLVTTNYARNFKLSKDTMQDVRDVEKEHIPYTESEMELVLKYQGELVADFILVQCYSGWRPQELLTMQIDKVDLENWTFTGGVKTEAGKNRTVPIHSRIRPIISEWYNLAAQRGSEYLFFRDEDKPLQISYGYLIRRFREFMRLDGISSDHRPHDGRKHFVTEGKRAGMDEYAIKHIVGHAITDITERTYTRRDMNWLAQEIEKIK